jgi:hypothetical protein
LGDVPRIGDISRIAHSNKSPCHLRPHTNRESPKRPPLNTEDRKMSFWEMSQELRTSPELHLPTCTPSTIGDLIGPVGTPDGHPRGQKLGKLHFGRCPKNWAHLPKCNSQQIPLPPATPHDPPCPQTPPLEGRDPENVIVTPGTKSESHGFGDSLWCLGCI